MAMVAFYALASILVISSPSAWARQHPYENSKPSAADVQWVEARRINPTMDGNGADHARVRELRCQTMPIRQFDPAGDRWNLEAVARCQYKVAFSSDTGWAPPISKNAVFIYLRDGCGEAGQEADLWCFMWHIGD
ncbi:hypothetical protein [Sphingopyxis sp.]|uniref:hypothetical protein n=1 Tax=Sphingopyxis sp. TaxID=1908224 RepID=UPI003D152B86